MSWYRNSQTQNENVSDYLFIEDVEDMLQRCYNRNREALKEYGYNNWREWGNSDYQQGVINTIDSYNEIYDMYLKNLPEGVSFSKALKAYHSGQLRQKPYHGHQQIEQMDMPESKDYESKYPWHAQHEHLSDAELVRLFTVSRQRINKTNESEVYAARKAIFLAVGQRNDLPILLELSKGQFNKLVTQWSGVTVHGMDIQNRANADIPDEHKWSGIQNASFLGMKDISHEDLDGFVKGVSVPESQKGSYFGDKGDYLRRTIITAFMSIDTGIDYSDLSFVIKNIKGSANGRYVPQTNTVEIDSLSQHTVSHEIGHYLDYKFNREGNSNSVIGLSSDNVMGKVSKEHLAWKLKYKQFIKQIMKKSDLWNAYTQTPTEVFARFIAQFVNWTSSSGKNRPSDEDRADRFDEIDFTIFIKLLQEKSYINKHFPPPTIS